MHALSHASIGLLLALGAIAQTPRHDAHFWRACLASDATPPAAADLPALLTELSSMLGSPDPTVRDDHAFAVLAKWLTRDACVPVAERRELLQQWTANLRIGIGSVGDDSVLLRSFSALGLSLLAATDARAPWMSADEFDRLLAAVIAYLREESDVRGFEAPLGWLHSVAHTADVLKFLLRNERLTKAQQSAVLAAIADKLATTDAPLVHGEDERLARVALSLVSRPDCDTDALRAFLVRAWPPVQRGAVSAATLAQHHNQRHFILSFHALLLVEKRALAALPATRAAAAALIEERLRG